MLLDIYGWCRGYRSSGRISISGRISNRRMAIGRGISGRPVAVVAETVTQQSHSQGQPISSVAPSMPVMMSMVAVTSASPYWG